MPEIIKKVVKIFVIIILSVILLNILLFVAFTIPGIQKAAADFALKKLQPKLQTEASIDKIRIKFFNRVELQGVYLEDRKQDTLVYAGKITVRANMLNLLHRELNVQSAELENFVINVDRKDKNSPHNFQFLIDAFKSDSVKVKKTSNPFGIYLADIRLRNGTLRYNVLSAPETPGQFNPDHLYVRNLNLRAAAPSIDMKKLKADIRTLSFWEHAGITVDDLQGMVRSDGTNLWSDRLDLTLNNSGLKVTRAQYNTDTKEFSLNAKSDLIDTKDAAIFSPRLTHLKKPFSFQADLEGKLPYVDVRNLVADYGRDTHVEINGLISDYSKFDDSDINIDVKSLRVSPDDLESFIRIGPQNYVSPAQLRALGNLELRLKAVGKLSRFNYNGVVRTAQGDVKLSGIGNINKDFSNMIFEGPVNADNVQLANIIGEGAGVDDATLNANVKVQIKKGLMPVIDARGQVASVLYKNYRYNNLNFDGSYNGKNIAARVSTDTEQNKLNLNADLNFGAQKKIDVTGTIDKLYLTPLFTRKNWQNPYLTARIDGHLSGSTIDDMAGTLVLDSTSLYDDNFIYNPGPIYVQALRADSVGEKKIQLMASFLEGEISGDYHFATIGDEIKTALNKHLPSVVTLPPKKKLSEGLNRFNFNFQLKNTEDLSYAFSLPFYNVEPATIAGQVDMTADELIALNAHIPRMMFGKNDIRESKIDLRTSVLSGIGVNANTYLVQDNGYINARLNTSASMDSVMNNLNFYVQNNVANANGQFKISMGFLRDNRDELQTNILVHPTDFLFNNKTISVHRATIMQTKDYIKVDNFGMSQNGMLLLGIDGVASKNENDNIRLYFNDTQLSTVLTAMNIQNIDGLLNGEIVVQRALQEPILHTQDFRIDNVKLYNDTIGTLRINGDWDRAKSGINLNAFLDNKGHKHLDVKGFVPAGNTIPMDLSIEINELPLAWVQPFAVSAFSELSGTVNSKMKITGKLSEPVTEGWLGVDKGIMQVAYSNVTYSISDTIRINPDNVGLNDLIIKDDNGHTANINVSLTHTNFSNLTYQVNLKLNDFLLLNNEERTDLIAYGNLKLSGDVKLTGSPNGIYGSVNLWNDSRSNVMIELPQTATASQYKGVIFVNTPVETDSLSFLRKNRDGETKLNTTVASGIPINIRGDVKLDPQLDIGVLINPTTGDAIDINGNGDLNIIYNSKADPSIRIYGDYIAEGGSVHYSLQSLKALDFTLRQGSTLTFEGDPLNTRFNITAYNRVKADLTTLSESFKAANLPTTRVPVDAVLEIQGDLEKINLRYNIELPESSEDVKQRVLNYISTEEARIRQFAYLVTTGSFYSAEGTPDMMLNNDRFTSIAANALTRGLDALFSSALNDNWSISTNMETQNGSFDNVRMGVDVSTRLLDDRLRISTNLSYGQANTFATQQAFLGEVDIEYKLYNWLMLHFYNHANERYYRRSPYTQGVGIIVTKEARDLKDLFRFNFNLGKKTENN